MNALVTKLRCRGCVFWYNPMKESRGECRRFPPSHADAGRRDVFPKTFADEWCGEFEERINE